MFKKTFKILSLIITISCYTLAQKPLFTNGSSVAFLGNSITHSGDFHHYVSLYYATRFPDQKVIFYNLGIRGNNANDFLKRMDIDILAKKVDYYVVMAGMNDVNRLLYNVDRQSDPEVQKQKQWALNDYRKNYEKVVQRLLTTGAKIILQKPSIYDQTGDLPTPNQPGVNDALQKCTEIIDELAKKYKLQTIDYFTLMKDINQKIQSVDPKKTIVGNDRVHPNAPGHFVMAYQFLKSTLQPNHVSAITIEKGKLKKAENVKVDKIVWNKQSVSFTTIENSLPFPIPTEAEPALSLVPFNEEFNTQLLQITSLPSGNYSLKIDGEVIRNFTAPALQKGVNLATIKTTPQYKQALLVAQQTIAYRNAQRKLRDLKFIEYSYFPKSMWGVSDIKVFEKITDSILQSLKGIKEKKYNELRPQFENYLKNKPLQAAVEKSVAELPAQIYAINKPIVHTYEIVKADNEMPDRALAPFGTNLASAEFAHSKSPGVYGKDYIYPNAAELDYFAAKGMGLFRLPFLWERIQHELNGELNEAELDRMMKFVDAARERKLYVLLDMHNYGRRIVNGKSEIIGSAKLSIDHLADAWQKIAEKFKAKDNIWAYGLMNEPHDMLKEVPWVTIAQASIDKIRLVDQKTPIMVGGDSYSSAARWLTESDNLKNLKDPSNQIIFEAHVYFDRDASGFYKGTYDEEKASASIGIERVKPFVNWLKANKFKGFIGEYTVPDDDPRWLTTLDKFLAYIKNNGLNGTYWAAGPWWGNYKLAIEPKDEKDRPQMETLMRYRNAKQPK